MNKMRYLTLAFVLAFAMLMVCTNGLAIGVSPTNQEVEFEPGLQADFGLKIINDQAKDMKAVLYARGELAEYISFHQTIVDLSSTEKLKRVKYTVKLPEKLEKSGVHTAEIVVMEYPKEFAVEGAQASVKAVGAVVSKFNVRVPYPSKYCEGKLQITPSNVGGDVVFTVSLFNFGKEDINNIRGDVEIFGPTYEKLGSAEFSETPLKASQSGKIVAKWKADVNPGVYHAVINVYYDNHKLALEKNFDVGSLSVDITKLVVDDFRLGEVAKMDLHLENLWNDEIKNVYGEVTVKDDKTTYTKFKTASVDIGALGEAVINAYWDTDGVSVGSYKVDVVLYYAGRTTEKSFDIEVNLDSIRAGTEVFGEAVSGDTQLITGSSAIMLLVVVLIIINIGWFLYMKRSKK